MTATQRRRAVEHLKNRRVSERRACRLIGFSRSAAWYRPKGRDDGVLRARLKRLAEQYPRYGYPTLHGMLQLEGLVVNRKRTARSTVEHCCDHYNHFRPHRSLDQKPPALFARDAA